MPEVEFTNLLIVPVVAVAAPLLLRLAIAVGLLRGQRAITTPPAKRSPGA